MLGVWVSPQLAGSPRQAGWANRPPCPLAQATSALTMVCTPPIAAASLALMRARRSAGMAIAAMMPTTKMPPKTTTIRITTIGIADDFFGGGAGT